METGVRPPEGGDKSGSVFRFEDEEDIIAFGEMCLKAIETVRRMNGGENDV